MQLLGKREFRNESGLLLNALLRLVQLVGEFSVGSHVSLELIFESVMFGGDGRELELELVNACLVTRNVQVHCGRRRRRRDDV